MTADSQILETQLPLLHDAQAYLKSRIRQQVPNSLLVLAWEEFYGLYDDLIRRFVRSQGVTSSDVDDCVQEVWTEVAKRLVEFHRSADRPGLRSWFYALVRSKTADVFRRKSRRPAESLDQAMANGREPFDLQTDPLALYQKKWEQAMFESVVARLRDEVSATNYQILCLRALKHCSTKHVAAELNLTREQVRFRYHRVMKKLRSYLADIVGESPS